MKRVWPLETQWERLAAVALLVGWAVLYLPNLRTSPNWYGDEGEWMEKCWTFIHGTPRVGPIKNDFVFPYPYPPFYMLVNGLLLRLFGYDLVVSRALGAVTGLAAMALLFWIGTRLRDRNFGFLCAVAFLVYAEANMNFRWVRSHPFAGMLCLAAVGFLVRYVQEKRLRDIALAGAMCALATATHYMTYPLIGAVLVTAVGVNWRSGKSGRLWGHAAVGGAVACSYAGLFVLWYVSARGWPELMAQVGRLTSVAANEVRPTMAGEVARFVENIWNLGFKTRTARGLQGPPGHDWWLTLATVGMVFLPVTKNKWLRAWMPFWLLVLMYGVFKKLNNVPLFFYPATIFLPVMALGVAGAVAWAGEGFKRMKMPEWLPVLVLAPFAWGSAVGAWGHFDSKIDHWTQHSVAEAEASMAYVNARTTPADIVVVPKQIYWLVRQGRPSMLTWCARYKGVDNDMPVPIHIPEEFYWYDPRLENVKYVVMASGIDTTTGRPRGIDLVYCRGLRGVPEVVQRILTEKWPVAYAGGQGVQLVQLGPNLRWPVVIGGEYVVFANPKLTNSEPQTP